MKYFIKNIIEKLTFGLNRLSSKLGFYIIPKWRSHDFMLVQRMKRIIDEYNIDCIIDVGANT